MRVNSGSDQYIILPTGKGKDLIVDAVSDLINIAALCLKNCRLTLGGDLINIQSAISGGIVTHWVVCG